MSLRNQPTISHDQPEPSADPEPADPQPKVRKPRAALTDAARQKLVGFLRRSENRLLSIDELTAAWNATRKEVQFRLSADRVADIMKEEGIRGDVWKASPAGERFRKRMLRRIGENAQKARDAAYALERAAQRELYAAIKADPERSAGKREIVCSACELPCFNTPEFFPVEKTTRKICPRRCLLCENERRRRYSRRKDSRLTLLKREKKLDYRKGVDDEARINRARLDSSGDALLLRQPAIDKRHCVGCDKTRPLRQPYFRRTNHKRTGGHSFSLLCSSCLSDADRAISRAKADKRPKAEIQALKAEVRALIFRAHERIRSDLREAALRDAEQYRGPKVLCPTCIRELPLNARYFFVYTLVRAGRRGEISRSRRTCRFCEAEQDALRRPRKT